MMAPAPPLAIMFSSATEVSMLAPASVPASVTVRIELDCDDVGLVVQSQQLDLKGQLRTLCNLSNVAVLLLTAGESGISF
jgi:hypothetical protein